MNATPEGALEYAQITYYYYRMGSVAPNHPPPPPCPPAPSTSLASLNRAVARKKLMTEAMSMEDL